MKQGFVSEIYASVQGEGPFAGERQIFVRLAGCPLRCTYCDTPESLVARGHPVLTTAQVMRRLKQLRRRSKAGTVSFTGGEPLAQALFVEELARAAKKNGFSVYLETAGIHVDGLARVAPFCDVVAMDMKLPSAVGRSYWDKHQQFLHVAGKKAFVKVVVEARSKRDEIRRAARLVAQHKPMPLLVLQPATPIPGRADGPSAEQVAEAYAIARRYVDRVLVMTQQHKLWGVR